MATITWVKTNVVGGVNLLAGRSPLIFIYEVTDWDTFEKASLVTITDVESDTSTTWTAIPYKDLGSNQRQYLIDSSSAVKSILGMQEDTPALTNVIEFVEDLTKEIKITVGDIEGTFIDKSFIACNSVAQFGSSETLTDLFNNTQKTYYAPKGEHAYVYFYSPSTEFQFSAEQGLFWNTEISQVFSRNNCSDTSDGSQVTYTVPEHTYSSRYSQNHADELAIADVLRNGQNYANDNGTCITKTAFIYSNLMQWSSEEELETITGASISKSNISIRRGVGGSIELYNTAPISFGEEASIAFYMPIFLSTNVNLTISKAHNYSGGDLDYFYDKLFIYQSPNGGGESDLQMFQINGSLNNYNVGFRDLDNYSVSSNYLQFKCVSLVSSFPANTLLYTIDNILIKYSE